ncbi:glycoside hydrolase family 71/99-like protein [Mucilaginibacter sp. PAMB04168]|uniref:glycoside hydrolase family 71/99-like protein n=1 Tax=Mucilaginibacter sp. PAMB04168 TaxID=3138567 RepID=UPI0031F69A61
MMKKYMLCWLSLLVCSSGLAQSKHSATSAFKSYQGLVMAGYQGWFNAPGDGAKRGWNHYRSRGEFAPGSIKVDMWPDMSEYKVKYKTPFRSSDSSSAYLFSSYDKSTVDLHFRWMQQYGIDGVFVQRFISNLKKKTSLQHNDRVLGNALNAAEKHHRAISLMYDLSGMGNEDVQLIMDDWKHLLDSLKLAGRGNKQSYLYHNGKPLIALWGVGFAKRQYLISNIEKIIDFLKNDPVYGGCSIMLGVPGYWRDLKSDTEPDPHLLDVFRAADIIHPWFVGRYDEAKYPAFKDHIAGDIKWCSDNHIDYVPTVYPGFSWHNMYPNSPQDQMPRNKGQFFWKQISGDISVGAKMLYIAMFDEIDEGTAIFKISKNPPVGKSNFVKFEEGIPNDYYLYLAGYAGRI